ncbi:MAG: LysR family transcriptional regulator, partial [Oscillospiraceae bacterium]|nr:LysR family transcriptional regulator [Oscillospiraceae bacterium]
MEIQQLRYFHRVCMLHSFTKAAKACFVSALGISMAIHRLEEELSCKLFERSAKELVLTEHARFLLPLAERIV